MVNWFSDKQDFYGMSTQSQENVETVEFEAGKKRYYLKNSSPKKVHTLSFTLWKREEEVAFWRWYEEDLLSRTQTVQLTDLVTNQGLKEYRMTEEPNIPDSQFPKECTVTLEEE